MLSSFLEREVIPFAPKAWPVPAPSRWREATPATAVFRICQQGKVLCSGKGIQSPN